jgi:hypothetical protein
MEEQARLAGRPPHESASITNLLELGLNEQEAHELSIAKVSFPMVSQNEWPHARDDQVRGQHYHLTQIPFDIEIDPATGLALVYKIFLHFEKPKTAYIGEAIVNLAKERFQVMQIGLGNILEPIAPFCSSRDDKVWNGMLKVHLKNPAIDGKQLLCGLRVFALELEGEIKIAKVAKGYDSSVLQGELSVKIKGEILANKDAGTLLVKIVKDNFSRGSEFEITQLNKNTSEDHAYLIAASPE